MNEAAAPASDEEVEFKLLVRGRVAPARIEELARATGFEVGAPKEVRHTDRYLDTAGLDLLRRGSALRIRSGATLARLCFKGGASLEGEALRRLEVEETVAADDVAPRRADALPRRLRDLVEPVTLTRPLVEIARLTTRRRCYELRHPPSGVGGELCIDRVRVLTEQGGAGSFVEVEIEAAQGAAATFAPLADSLVLRLGLELAQVSKLERARMALGAAPALPLVRRPALRPEMPFREAAVRVLRVHFEALREAEPIARLGEDAEGVHRMRVSTRRLRAAVRIFAAAFGPKRLVVAKRLFGKTGRMLGPVRDLDVMLARMPVLSHDLPRPLAAELAPLLDLLGTIRADERRRMLAWLDARSRLREMDRFDRFLARYERRYRIGEDPAPRSRRRRHEPGEQATGEQALALLHAAARRVFKQGDRIERHSPPEELHLLRIAVKRLRYTADALADVAPRDVVLWLKQTSEIQDLLGAYNDARVMEARLTRWMDTRAGCRLPRKTLLAVGGLLGVQERRARAARKAFRQQWKEFSREKWRRRLVPPPQDAPPDDPSPTLSVPSPARIRS